MKDWLTENSCVAGLICGRLLASDKHAQLVAIDLYLCRYAVSKFRQKLGQDLSVTSSFSSAHEHTLA